MAIDRIHFLFAETKKSSFHFLVKLYDSVGHPSWKSIKLYSCCFIMFGFAQFGFRFAYQ